MLKLPSNWNEVTIAQYLEIVEILSNLEMNYLEQVIEIVAILNDTSTDDPMIEDMDLQEMQKTISNLKWLFNEPKNTSEKELCIEVRGKEINLKCKELKSLVLAEFIDLEYYFAEDRIKSIPKIASIIYKQYKEDEWGNIIEEPYEYNIFEREAEFENLPVSSLWGVKDMYLTFREEFLTIYRDLFEDPNNDVIENENELDPQEVLEMKKEIEEEKKISKWGWESLIWNLSGNDLSKFNQIISMPLILVMNMLSMKKSLAI